MGRGTLFQNTLTNNSANQDMAFMPLALMPEQASVKVIIQTGGTDRRIATQYNSGGLILDATYAAWNNGTTGSTTADGDRLNTQGATSAIAWIIVERCS